MAFYDVASNISPHSSSSLHTHEPFTPSLAHPSLLVFPLVQAASKEDLKLLPGQQLPLHHKTKPPSFGGGEAKRPSKAAGKAAAAAAAEAATALALAAPASSAETAEAMGEEDEEDDDDDDKSAGGRGFKVGPDRYCSPRHRMPLNKKTRESNACR